MWPDLIYNIESDVDIKRKLSYLNTFINVHGINLQEGTDVNLVKSKIKQFCTDATQRAGGLLLLYAVVHCSSTVYVDNWSQIVLGSLKVPDSIISREIPLKVLNKMLVNFGHEPDYSDVFSRLIPEILPILLDPQDDKVYKLSCQSLAICMKCVPEITGTRVADIENLLLKELHNPYGEIVEATGECFAALPLCISRLQRKGTVDYKDIWCNLFTKMLNTTNLMLNSITRLTEDHADYVNVKNLPVFEIPLDVDSEIPLTLIDTVKSLCQCMAKMMSTENELVRLPISDLLLTLSRIIEVEKVLKVPNEDQWIGYLKLGYSQLVIGAFVVLEAVISNFAITEQSRNFVNLMNKSLTALENIKFPLSHVSLVRGSAWKLINVWLNQYGSKASRSIATNKTIIDRILVDIDTRERKKETDEKKSSDPKQSKTTSVQTKTTLDEKNKIANKIFTCNHALKVLKNLFELDGCHLPKNHLDEVCSTLLRISIEVTGCTTTRQPYPVPYFDGKCRKLLYDVFLCCAIYSDPLHSKCILEAQKIFNVASTGDASTKVRRVCHRFRKLSRYYLNPRKPPPDVVQYSHPSLLKRVQQPVTPAVKSEWGEGIEWSAANGHSSDELMDDNGVVQDQVGDEYPEKMVGKGGLEPIEQVEESESHMNHSYNRKSSQSMGEEEEDSMDDSDIEPTYIATDSNPQRIAMNDSSHINSFEMQSCVEQYTNETRTERHATEEVVSNARNAVENNYDKQSSSFVEVKSVAQKQPQYTTENGGYRRKENALDSEEEEDSDMDEGDEEGEAKDEDEEGEVNEDGSENGVDDASDGKRSPDYEEERPRKRQRCMDEEEDVDEEVEDEDPLVNNQSSDEEESAVNDLPAVEPNAETNSEIPSDEVNQINDKDNDCSGETLQSMIDSFVLVEAKEIS